MHARQLEKRIDIVDIRVLTFDESERSGIDVDPRDHRVVATELSEFAELHELAELGTGAYIEDLEVGVFQRRQVAYHRVAAVEIFEIL